MELDELKGAWQTLDQTIHAGMALNLEVLKELKLDKTRSALKRLAWLVRVELFSGIVTALLIGSFLAGDIHEARFAIPALVLLAVVVLTIAVAARHLAMIDHIDYAAPVVSIQRAVTLLRASRVRTTKWLLLFAPLLWTPLAIVGARGLLGLDLYRGSGLWLPGNLGVGVVMILLIIWIAHRWADPRGERNANAWALQFFPAQALAGRVAGAEIRTWRSGRTFKVPRRAE